MLQLFWKTTKWLLLLTLPLTIFPIFMGTLGGVLFPVFHERHISATVDKYLHDLKDVVSDWGVGGNVPTFRQFQDKNNKFHLTRVNTNDWASKLGFVLPLEYSDPDMILSYDTPIDKQASLGTLMRETGSTKADRLPQEQWLLLTRLEWLDWDGWNAAFDDLLRHSYTDSHLNSSGFHFAECSTSSTASFLCSVWNTRAPALVHFLVEKEPLPEGEIDPDLSYALPYNKMLPVTVRIIELGLQDAYTGLPWTTFPSKEKQLRAIVAGDRMYEQFEPFTSPEDLLQVRFNDYMDQLLNAKGTILNHINEMDWWMVRNINRQLGIEELTSFIHGVCFTVTLIISTAINALIVRPVRALVDEFLGTPLPGDVVFADMQEEQDTDPNDDIFGLNQLFQGMSAEAERAASKAGRTAAANTSAPPSTSHASDSARI